MTDTITVADRKAAWPFRPACYTAENYDFWMAGTYDVAAPVIRAFARRAAQAIEAGTAETQGGSVHESAVRQDAPKSPPPQSERYSVVSEVQEIAGREAMQLGVRAFILETASIERDVLLSELTMDEIESLVHAVLATTALQVRAHLQAAQGEVG